MVTVDERWEDLAFLRDVWMQGWGVGKQEGTERNSKVAKFSFFFISSLF